MRFTTLLALTTGILMTSEVEAVSLKQALIQIQSDSYNTEHQDVLLQL